MLKPISEQKALKRLDQIRSDLRSEVVAEYEHRAKSCLMCETPGACCLDEHFVNVHISRVEGAAIRRTLDKLPETRRAEIYARVERVVEEYTLSAEGDTFAQTYACPLFEKSLGCLVHAEAKPLACITHACYEKQEHLPPDSMLAEREALVETLDRRTYGRPQPRLPIPLAIRPNN